MNRLNAALYGQSDIQLSDRLVGEVRKYQHRAPITPKLSDSDARAPSGTVSRSRCGIWFSRPRIHEAVTCFTMYTYTSCWPVRTLHIRMSDGHEVSRSPAMAAGLTDHVWSIREWLAYPAVQRE